MGDLTISNIAEMDRQCRELVGLYSKARIKIGLEIAKLLKLFRDGDLYMQLDRQSYPTFNTYLESVGIKYKTAMEVIGLYEAYVIAGGYTIDELAGISYHKLTGIKPLLFLKEGGEYKMRRTREEADKWITDAKSELTQGDLRQKRMEEEAGPHEHEFKEVRYRVCTICKLKEFHGGTTKQS